MKAQSVGDTSSLEFMRGRRVLEINPEHPIIRNLNVRWNKNPVTLHIYDMHSYTHLVTSNVTSSNNILTLVCRLHMGVTQMMMMLLEPLIFALRAIDLLYDTALVSSGYTVSFLSFSISPAPKVA